MLKFPFLTQGSHFEKKNFISGLVHVSGNNFGVLEDKCQYESNPVKSGAIANPISLDD